MKHKHAEVIKAWADGAIIEEYRPNLDQWVEPMPYPIWDSRFSYRIKPESKPDVVEYYAADSFNRLHLVKEHDAELKVIFDGETSNPKSVEVIK